jgi:adenylate cyclase
MACKLVFRRNDRREEVPLRGRTVKIGREGGNDVVVDHEDRSISRFHARLDHDGTYWRIVDTHSRNGVRVNGALIPPGDAGARLLADGDTVVLGSLDLRFVREDEALRFDTDRPDTGSVTLRPTALQDLPGLIEGAARVPLPREAEEAVERAKRAVTVLAAVGRTIAAVTPVDDIIDAIVDLVFEATPAERAALFLWDDEAGRLVPKRTRTRAARAADAMTVSDSLVHQAFAEKATVQMEPGGKTSESMHRLSLRAAVAVPLVHQSQALGVIYADTSQVAASFDPFSVALLSALASHTALALEQARLLRKTRQEERHRAKLEQYLPTPVVNRLLSGESTPGLAMKAEEVEVTVLFCDMAGFTSRTEDMEPHHVLLLLNRCFSDMTEVVQAEGGVVDKYIGDCLMAVFGAPFAQTDHAQRAARSALGLRDAIGRINAEGTLAVGFRIGMHSGRAVAGDVGHVTRRNWTVLGATVNLASRMESSIAQPGQIVLTGQTRAALGDGFDVRPIEIVKAPKGITRDFQAFELLGLKIP